KAGQYGAPFYPPFGSLGMVVSVQDTSNGLIGGPLSVRTSPYDVKSKPAALVYAAYNGFVAHRFTLSVSAGNYQVQDNGQLVYSQPVSQTTDIQLRADPGADSSLTLDFSGGVIGVPVAFDGGNGPGAHVLTITGGAFSAITNDVSGPGAGTLSFTAGGTTAAVTYTGLTQAVLNPA